MLGKNLRLDQFVDNPAITNIHPVDFWIGGLHVDFGTLGSIHVDTLLLTWACMAGILVAGAAIVPRLAVEGAGGKGQMILEMYYSFIDDLAKGTIGHHAKKFFPLIAAIFIFVLIGNFVGIGPWHAFEHMQGWFHLTDGEPFELASPTTDFNVTAALATIAVLTYLGTGFWLMKGKYLIHLANPIEWLDLVIRPSTLALRLMIVITADELMRAAIITMQPVVLPTGIMAFEMFIGLIQAFVFALLTSIYIGLTTAAEHH
jgi:F-type H+-transporting ATPase subunit a